MLPVTIVIPTKNEEKYLPLCFDSLLGQVTFSDEILLVDGGSEDATLAIADSYRDRLPIKILFYPDSSIGQARHLGVEYATNDIILQTDGDLTFSEGFMDKLRMHYEQNPEVVGVTGGWRDAKGRILGNFTCAVLEGIFRYADCLNSYRREAYYKTGGHPDTSFGEQILLWNQISRKRDSFLQTVRLQNHHVQRFKNNGKGQKALSKNRF